MQIEMDSFCCPFLYKEFLFESAFDVLVVINKQKHAADYNQRYEWVKRPSDRHKAIEVIFDEQVG